MKKKILKYIIIGIVIFVTVIAIEFGCLYAVHGDNIWNWLKEFWEWYIKLL